MNPFPPLQLRHRVQRKEEGRGFDYVPTPSADLPLSVLFSSLDPPWGPPFPSPSPGALRGRVILSLSLAGVSHGVNICMWGVGL